MGRQWMIAGLVEECGFLGSRFWKVAIAASIARRFHFGISSDNGQTARLRTLSTREQPWSALMESRYDFGPL
jgi:hypothetical protein